MKIDKHIFMSFSFILIGLRFSSSDLLEFLDLWEFVKDKPKHIRLLIDETSKDVMKVTQQVVPKLLEFSSVEIFDLPQVEKVESLSNFNIIIGNIKLNLLNFVKTFDRKKFLIPGYFLIFTLNCSIIDDGRLFDLAWLRYIVNFNVICHEQDKLWLETFQPFTNNVSCDKLTRISKQLSQINRNNIDLFPKKLSDFQGCPIKLATFYYPPITMRDEFANGSFRYYGSEMELAFGIVASLNSAIDMRYVNKGGSVGLLLDNGTATGFLKQTIEGEVDMLMGFYYLTYLRTQYMSFTESHYSIPLVIMIPYGEPWTAFEKLIKPLEGIIWLFLVATFGAGTITIAVINCQSENVKKFIFGDRYSNPYFNLISVFVGNGLTLLPRRNFARSLLMMYMLFCLVMRTVYQGSLFIILQSDGRHPEVRSIEEMMEKNFVFYIRETLEHNIKSMAFYSKRKTVKFDDYPMLRQKTLDPAFRGGVIQPLLEIIYLNQQNYKNFTYNVLKEYLLDVQIVNYFPKHSYLVEPFNEKIGILKSAGLVKLWMEKYIDQSYVKINSEGNSGAKVMSIIQLSGGFQVLLLGYVVSFSVFVLELIARNVSKKLRYVRNRKTSPRYSDE